MRYIITKNKEFFQKIGEYNYADLDILKGLPKIIAIDTETTGLNAREDDIFCVQIATYSDSYIIDLQKHPQLPNEDLVLYFEELMPYIKDKILVFQNGLFDVGFFYNKNFFPKKILDTYIASKLIYNGYNEYGNFLFDLGSIFERELNVKVSKFEQKNISKVKLSQASTIEYSFVDVERLLELHDVLFKKIEKLKLNLSYEINCNFALACAYMEQCGLPISKHKWVNKMEEDKKLTNIQVEKIVNYIYDNLPDFRDSQLDLFSTEKKLKISLTSNQQMIPVFEQLGIDILIEDPKNKGKKKKSIEVDVLKKTKHTFIDMWIEYKKRLHDVTTFGQNILDKIENNKIYSRFNLIVDTGRISSRSGEINFLNFPATKSTRDAIEANKGYLMVVSDYEGQENVVTADITGDKVMVDSILNGSCLHCAYARIIYPEIKDLSDEEIKTNHKEKRQAAKAPRFAFSYGGTSFTVANNLNITIEEAKKLEDAYKELHSGIFEYANKSLPNFIKEEAIIQPTTNFRLKLPNITRFKELDKKIKSLGKEFWEYYREGKQEYKEYQEYLDYINKQKSDKTLKDLPKVKKPNSESYKLYLSYKSDISYYFALKSQYFRLTLNNPSQGLSSHQSKLALFMMFELIKENGHIWKSRLCNMPYDEIVMEVKEDLAEYYAKKLGDIMIEAGNILLPNKIVKMNAQGNIGKTWYEAK